MKILMLTIVILAGCDQISNDIIIIEKTKCDWGKVMCRRPKEE